MNGAKAPRRPQKTEIKHTWRLGTGNWASVRKLIMSVMIIMTYKWHKMFGAGPIAHKMYGAGPITHKMFGAGPIAHKMFGAGPTAHANCTDVPKLLVPQLYTNQNQNNTSSLLQYACACHGSLFAIHFNARKWQYIPTKSIHDYTQSLESRTDFEAWHMISVQHVSKLDAEWMTQSSRWVCHIYRLVTYEAQRHWGGGNKGRTCVALMKPYHSYCKPDYWTNWNIGAWIHQTERGTETT